jgi:hypothetical protein
VQSTYELVEGPPWSEAQPHCQECPARRCCHAATHRQSATRERRAALWAREERSRRALGSGDRRGAGCRGGRAALVRSSTVADVRAPPVLTPRPGRAAPLVRDLHRAQPALARQPAQGAASVPGRRRHGCHVSYMSFKVFEFWRCFLSFPLLVRVWGWPSQNSSKQEVPNPRWLGSSRACPELHLACRDSHHDNQPSRLLCAQGSETSTPHSTWERAKVCPNPALARAPDSSRAQLTRTDAPFLLSWQVRASRSSRSPTTLARRSKQPVPPRTAAAPITALAHPAPHLRRAAPCSCTLTLITHA